MKSTQNRQSPYEVALPPLGFLDRDSVERFELQTLLKEIGEPISGNMSEMRERAEKLVTFGFEAADAAHVAFAEHCGAQFITCDEKLIKKCFAHKIEIWCGNPVSFCEKERLR